MIIIIKVIIEPKIKTIIRLINTSKNNNDNTKSNNKNTDNIN